MNLSLTEHSPDILSMNMLNLKYDPDATCPKIEKFLQDITKYNPKAYTNIKKMFGYCLYQSCKYQRAFMLYGLGDNGKSVLLDLLSIFLGTDNTCHIALHELCDDKNSKFVVGELNGKLANIYPDIPLKTLHDVSIFKATVAGDRIKGEFKFMKPFYFSSYAVHVYSCNRIPESKDDTYAYFKRWVLIPFYATFQGTDQVKDLLSTFNYA